MILPLNIHCHKHDIEKVHAIKLNIATWNEFDIVHHHETEWIKPIENLNIWRHIPQKPHNI